MARNKLTDDKMTLFIDQHGHHIFARTLKELCSKSPWQSPKVSKMYRDIKPEHGGGVAWVGYVVGRSWFEAFRPVRVMQ